MMCGKPRRHVTPDQSGRRRRSNTALFVGAIFWRAEDELASVALQRRRQVEESADRPCPLYP